jgi:hypothetical protein
MFYADFFYIFKLYKTRKLNDYEKIILELPISFSYCFCKEETKEKLGS